MKFGNYIKFILKSPITKSYTIGSTMTSPKTILEFGEDNNVIENLFNTNYKIVSVQKDKIEDLIKYGDTIKFVVVNTSVLNGSSVKLIENIRQVYNGIVLVLVASQDVSISKLLVNAGADDILYLNDITREKVEQSVERCETKRRLTTNLEKMTNL